MYAMHCTKPDISFAVCKLSRYTNNPSTEHWKAIGRVLGYLKRTIGLGLYDTNFPSILEGYTDASWITPMITRLRLGGFLPLVVERFHGLLRNRRVFHIPQWNLNL
jgi:hypothetical protein